MGQIEIDEEKVAAFAQAKKRLDEEQKAADQAKKPSRPSSPSPTILKPVVKIQPKPPLKPCVDTAQDGVATPGFGRRISSEP